MERKNGKVAIAIVAMFVVALSIVGITYAYFTAGITNNSATKSISASAGKLVVSYTEGQDTIVVSNIVPGWMTDNDSYYDPLYSAVNDNGTIKITAVKESETQQTPTVDPTDYGQQEPYYFQIGPGQGNTGTVTYAIMLYNIENGIPAADQTNFEWRLYTYDDTAVDLEDEGGNFDYTEGTALTDWIDLAPGTAQSPGSQLVAIDTTNNTTGTKKYFLMLRYNNNTSASQNTSQDVTVYADIKVVGVKYVEEGNYQTYYDEDGNIISQNVVTY